MSVFPLIRPVRLLAAASLVVSLSFSSAFAQSATATTDPVGFITLNVAGKTGSAPALSFKSLGLARQVEYQGNAEAVTNPATPQDSATLRDDDSAWVDDQ